MKKVLMISYYYPPRPGIASNRLGGLAKYLTRYGWEPTILTAELPKHTWPPYAKVVETNCNVSSDVVKKSLGLKKGEGLKSQLNPVIYSMLTKINPVIKELIEYPDDFKSWIPIAIKKGLQIAKEQNYDALITSSSPVSTHIIGNKISGQTGIPWIADLRDLWTQNHYYKYSGCRKIFEQRLEKDTLKHASALITVSEPLAQTLSELHSNPVYTITNGFDPDEIRRDDTNAETSSKLIITYTGQTYDGKRDPTILFKVISEMIEKGEISREKILVRFYGPYSEYMALIIKEMHLENIVCHYGLVDRSVSIQRQQESTILLMLNWNDPAEAGVYTGKIFEYLAARKPILAIGGPGGVVKDLLDETQAGVYVNDEENLKRILQTWIDEIESFGKVRYFGNFEMINKYSHINMAMSFAKLLDIYGNKD